MALGVVSIMLCPPQQTRKESASIHGHIWSYGHIVVMEKRVKVAELKAQLSAHLRTVRRGGTLTVCDRDIPVARLVPFRDNKEVLDVRKPTRSLADVADLDASIVLPFCPTAVRPSLSEPLPPV